MSKTAAEVLGVINMLKIIILNQLREVRVNYALTSDNIEIVQCDSCDSWYHFNYVNLTADIANQPWVCETCCALHTSNSASGVNKCEPPSFYKRSQIQVKPTLQ